MPDLARPAGFSLEDAVLDIGGDIGALILYTNADLAGREIEVSRIDEPDPRHDDAHVHDGGHQHGPEPDHVHGQGHEHRVHTAILERRAGGAVTYAGIYPELTAGRYRVWIDDPALPDQVTIVGGEVAELDWR